MPLAGLNESRKTQRIDAWDGDFSWHPFTQMQEYLAHPRLFIERAEGCWLYDTEGNRYLDANASIWTNVHGHNDPELNAALTSQLGRMAHTTYLGLGHGPGAELAAKLAALAPGDELSRVFYSDNGSNAVEIALKLSFQFWQLSDCAEKTEVISLRNAYHGDTFGTMSVGDSGGFHARFKPWCFPVTHVDAPRCEEFGGETFSQDAAASLEQMEAALREHKGRTAAVIVEPWMQGSAGMRVLPKGYLKVVESLCRRYGAHLIVDEVFTGFGRMGHLLVSEAEGVEPDFICLAKGLTAGYVPLAATLTTQSIYDAFLGAYEQYKAFFHGHTFTGNPLAAAVALCNISKLERMLSTGRLPQAVRSFEAFFRRLRKALPEGFALRQRGVAGAIDLPAGDVAQRRAMQVCLSARTHGIALRALGDTLLIVPPLVISEQELDFLFDGLLASLQQHRLLG